MRIHRLDTATSTNEEALLLSRSGERRPVWIVARRQTAGRGRRGRRWVSEPGNLYASLLVTDPSSPERAPELSFVAALAVHDAIIEGAPSISPHLAVKWPNDLLYDRRKIGGILVEGESSNTGLFAAVIGIGLNCSHHPNDIDYPATDLAHMGLSVTPDDIFAVLSRTMLSRIAQWDRGAGFPSIRADWLARASGIGEEIRVALSERELIGRFESLDPLGRLVICLPDGRLETITAGDVFPLSAPGVHLTGEAR